MSTLIRQQNLCYYTTPQHQLTWLSRFGFLYQGEGTLALYDSLIVLKSREWTLAIDFDSIKCVGLGQFSNWSKPFGLSYLFVRYKHEREATDMGFQEIDLVPAYSPFAATWKTNEVVEDWCQTLSSLEGLRGRVERPGPSGLLSD